MQATLSFDLSNQTDVEAYNHAIKGPKYRDTLSDVLGLLQKIRNGHSVNDVDTAEAGIALILNTFDVDLDSTKLL